jgi:hypothetical protein
MLNTPERVKMNNQYFIKWMIVPVVMLASCKDPVAESGFVAPEPPVEINDRNLISLEFYSRLNDETLFGPDGYQPVVERINTNTSALAYFFDRSDALIGQKSSTVDIARKTKTKTFFVQNNLSTAYVEGTGIVVRPIINAFEGFVAPDTLFAGGCTLVAPLGQPVTVTLMTCRITEKQQFQALVRNLGDVLKTNRVLTGTIRNSLTEEFGRYLKYNLKDFRLSFFKPVEANPEYQLFFLTPLNFVFRGAVASTVGTVPLYECKIEYLR